MNIRAAYAQTEDLLADPAQQAIVERLAELQRRLTAAGDKRNGLLSRLWRPPQPVTGLYLWGGVGRGKTFLMDLFYASLGTTQKRRIHFHRLMSEVHAQLRELSDTEDPLDKVAENLAGPIRVLCFDEFFVSDIGDAMILGRLLRGLFERGVTLVATSNVKPDDLYAGGLQRERFLPAIDLLNAKLDVVELDSGTDYRLRVMAQAGTFFLTGADTVTDQLNAYVRRIAPGATAAGEVLEIRGRPIPTIRTAKGVAWFDFDALCEGPRSQEDYIEIARCYQTVVISDVPVLNRSREDAARRFIALVDEFYDRRVKLILSAAARPVELYTGERLAFEFERTQSRLIEMQSVEYLAAAHLT